MAEPRDLRTPEGILAERQRLERAHREGRMDARMLSALLYNLDVIEDCLAVLARERRRGRKA